MSNQEIIAVIREAGFDRDIYAKPLHRGIFAGKLGLKQIVDALEWAVSQGIMAEGKAHKAGSYSFKK